MASQVSDADSSAPIVVRVTTLSEVKRAEESVRAVAASIGFGARDCEELALAAVELASNLVKHADGGVLTFDAVHAGDRLGISIESEDRGPGIVDFEQALTDGYSTAGTLGNGLGTVNRLMDELAYHSLSDGGARIVCRRWLRTGNAAPLARRLEFGVASRSRHMSKENGDAFVVRQWSGNALVGVIDGLGHGQFAQRAAQTARYYIEQHYDQPLGELFRGVGRVCRSTRGVVMALALFDHARNTIALASVGNIQIRIIGASEPANLVLRRGVLGFNAPQPVVCSHPWRSNMLLIMHSDGLRTQWSWADFRNLHAASIEIVARQLLRELGKDDDDATIVVARSLPA